MTRIGRALRANRRAVAVVGAAVLLALLVPGQREAAAGAAAAVALLSVPLRRRRVAAAAERSTEAELRASGRDARRLLGAANINWVAPVVVLWCEFPAQ